MNMRIPLLLLSAGAVLTGLFAGQIISFVSEKIIPVLL
jgi:hypothetical protein